MSDLTLNVIKIGARKSAQVERLEQTINRLESEILEKEELAEDLAAALVESNAAIVQLTALINEIEEKFGEIEREKKTAITSINDRLKSVSNQRQAKTKSVAFAMNNVVAFLQQTPKVGYCENYIARELGVDPFALGHALNYLHLSDLIELVDRKGECYWRLAVGEVVA